MGIASSRDRDRVVIGRVIAARRRHLYACLSHTSAIRMNPERRRRNALGGGGREENEQNTIRCIENLDV